MEAKEFMIGDWVKFGKEYFQVDGYFRISNTIVLRYNGHTFLPDNGCVVVEDTEPIPLTDEILRLNDFEYNHKAYANYKDTNIGVWCHLNYSYTDDERYSMYNHVGIWFVLGSEEMKISYVHELQHALRLCGLNDLADNFKIE